MARVHNCPKCGVSIEASEGAAGTGHKCPKCDNELTADCPQPSPDQQEPPKNKSNVSSTVSVVFRNLLYLCIIFAVVVSSVGVLILSIRRVSDGPSNSIHTMNNLSQCAKAAHLAHDNIGKFPPYYGTYAGKTGSYHTHLLPYVDMVSLYNREPLNTEAMVPAYLSYLDPTWDGAGTTNFPVNLRLFFDGGGLGTLSPPNDPIYPRMPQSFQQDGTSNTLLYATKYQHCGEIGGSLWADSNSPDSPTAATFGFSMGLWQRAPTRAACNPTAGTAVSFFPDRIHAAFCDATVRIVSDDISAVTWQEWHTPNGGTGGKGTDWDQ
jgi:hypothetical protein